MELIFKCFSTCEPGVNNYPVVHDHLEKACTFPFELLNYSIHSFHSCPLPLFFH